MQRQDLKHSRVQRRILFSVSTLCLQNSKGSIFYFCLFNISYNLITQHLCLYLVVETYQVLVSLHIHQVLSTPAAAMCIRHILRRPEDSRIQALMVLMQEPRQVTRRKATVVHIRHIRQSPNQYIIIVIYFSPQVAFIINIYILVLICHYY